MRRAHAATEERPSLLVATTMEATGPIRRGIDIGVSLLGLALTALLLPLLATIIRCDSPGPILYRQTRAGRGGRCFVLHKFRSMYDGSDNESWTLEDDPRITACGHWLRRSHLDELPQFWNVLKGDMTLIGPRPERPEVLEWLRAEDPGQVQRLTVAPGLTSLAAVTHGYAGTPEQAGDRLSADLWYLANRSLWLDLRILSMSLLDVVALRGR